MTTVFALADSDRYGSQKVVYHINFKGGEDSRAYRGSMRNIQNHINAVGAVNLETKIVLHGDGLGLTAAALEDERLQTQLLSLKGQGVEVVICANTLTGRGIDYEMDLFDVYEDDIVPSGVAELSYLQQQGFTYIRPR
ncbi:MAG: DsrE family protein [Pseudomonadota bacterium]